MKITFDLFPALVRVIPAGALDDAARDDVTVHTRVPGSRLVSAVRVIILDGTAMIAGDSSEGPMLLFRERIEPPATPPDRAGRGITRLVTHTGKVIVIEKDANCGCGSRLRGWNPYKTMSSIKDPTE